MIKFTPGHYMMPAHPAPSEYESFVVAIWPGNVKFCWAGRCAAHLDREAPYRVLEDGVGINVCEECWAAMQAYFGDAMEDL